MAHWNWNFVIIYGIIILEFSSGFSLFSIFSSNEDVITSTQLPSNATNSTLTTSLPTSELNTTGTVLNATVSNAEFNATTNEIKKLLEDGIAQLSNYTTEKQELEERKVEKREIRKKKLHESCYLSEECIYPNTICDPIRSICICDPEAGLACAEGVAFTGYCLYDEQCEYVTANSMCREGICLCRGHAVPEVQKYGTVKCKGKKFGDQCTSTEECGFKNAICDPIKHSCQCHPLYTATNQLDKCGKPAKVDEDCFFNEQCEQALFRTVCLNGKCVCRSEGTPILQLDGTIKCLVINDTTDERYVDPAMIIVLSVMALMFIIICVVLHLFSKARWRENRTIFNTPNPRLMNVSLLKETQKADRRESKVSKDGPSRDPSLGSIRQNSPSVESKSAPSRRESRSTIINNGNGYVAVKSPVSKMPPIPSYSDDVEFESSNITNSKV